MRASLECSIVGTHESSRKDQVWQLNFHVVNVLWTQLQPSEMFFELHESFDPRLAIFLAGLCDPSTFGPQGQHDLAGAAFCYCTSIFQLQESGHYWIYSLEQLVFLEKLK